MLICVLIKPALLMKKQSDIKKSDCIKNLSMQQIIRNCINTFGSFLWSSTTQPSHDVKKLICKMFIVDIC